MRGTSHHSASLKVTDLLIALELRCLVAEVSLTGLADLRKAMSYILNWRENLLVIDNQALVSGSELDLQISNSLVSLGDKNFLREDRSNSALRLI